MMFPKPTRKKDQKTMKKVKARPCLICRQPSDPAHVKTQGSGGDDILDNLVPLCRVHHTEQHTKGWVYMYKNYRDLQDELFEKGWVVMSGGGREKLVKK